MTFQGNDYVLPNKPHFFLANQPTRINFLNGVYYGKVRDKKCHGKGVFSWDNGEFYYGITIVSFYTDFSKVNGNRIRWMVKEYFSLLMEEYSKGNSTRIKSMELRC